ncbi:hypothetical protein S40293_00716 [Stachybotrys chartarum IBT 40293]|nr:hypothetical protein S40293_00716 [Stachybotrys chartarum IBT 40293]
MAISKDKGRAHLFQDPDEQVVEDYDPEATNPGAEAGSDSDDDNDEYAGTEHYEKVGDSKLRRKEVVSLGPKYHGARITREDLEAESEQEDEDEDDDGEEYDDPETADLARDQALANDSEIDSDEALAESDSGRLKNFVFRGSGKPKGGSKKRPTAADYMLSSDDEGAQVQSAEDSDLDDDLDGAALEDSDEDDMDDGLDGLADGLGESEDEEDDDDEEEAEDSEDGDEEDEEDEDDSDNDETTSKRNVGAAKPMLGALSNTADVEKGLAIRQQRKYYDGLLNLRIRLQKALVATNTLPTLEDSSDADSEPYEAAEEAAIKLLNTISTLRDGFGSSARAGEKRKRGLDAGMPTQEIWEQLVQDDQRFIKFREDRLEKWSRKVQAVNVTTTKALGAKTKPLTEALQEQLADPDNRLIKRTRVPRSCAPAQAAQKATRDDDIFDDADFYQLLLKELVDQRTVESAGEQASAVPSVMLTAAREAKNRKTVDRKASKGRKMRFTVHEKLQNFMAPEDRRSWEQEQIDRFFGTLFGRKMQLNEEESEDEDMDDVDAAEEGLRLFRN